jgi:DNA-binding NarL/FixJ family response regulator
MSTVTEFRTDRGDDLAREHSRREADEVVVLVIEPRQLFRECLCQKLSHISDIDTVSVSKASEYRSMMSDSHRPDVVLYCISDGDSLPMDPSEVVGSVEELDSTPLVVLSNDRPAMEVYRVLKSGFRGFLPSSISSAVAIQALRLVKAGGTFVPVSCLGQFPELAAMAEQGDTFTRRQRQVIESIRQGKPNKIIAYELSMCESTVKVHVRTIMKKLKAKNRTQVAYMYRAND